MPGKGLCELGHNGSYYTSDLDEIESVVADHISGTVKLRLKGEADLKKIKKAVSSAGYKMK